MEVTATISSINSGITRDTSNSSDQEETRLNAFGIGEANKTEVELSPQARILQQTDANQRDLSERLEEQRQAARERAEQEQQDDQAQESNSTNGFVSVASSEGRAQRNNLSSEKAAEVYQAISKLV